MSDAFWFTKSPEQITKEHLGLDIHPGKLRDLVDLADCDIGVWSFLDIGKDRAHLADDVVNLALGPLAIALKERGLNFRDRWKVLNPVGFQMWLNAIEIGLIPKQVRKEFDTAIVTRFNRECGEMYARHAEIAKTILDDNPEDRDAILARVDLDTAVFGLVSLGPWIANTVFWTIVCDVIEPMLDGPSNSELEAIIDRIMAENPAQVEKARAEPKLIGWFIGQVGKLSTTKPDPAAVRGMIENKLK